MTITRTPMKLFHAPIAELSDEQRMMLFDLTTRLQDWARKRGDVLVLVPLPADPKGSA